MKLNKNKCLGPRKGGAAASYTTLEVQDCNGGNAQAWISGETAQGSGIFMFKNVCGARPLPRRPGRRLEQREL